MQGHAGEESFITWFAGLGWHGHDISRWSMDQSFLHCTGAAADSPGPELGIMGNKGHFTPSSGMISSRSYFKQHNTSLVTNHEIPFQDFARFFPLSFPTGKTYTSFYTRLCKWFQCSWTNFPVPKHLIHCQKIFMTVLQTNCSPWLWAGWEEHTLDANTFNVVLKVLSPLPAVTVNLFKLHPDSRTMFTKFLLNQVLLFQGRC